jgi:hypothetical protein
MNIDLFVLLFWSVLIWIGWWARGKYGSRVGQAVAPVTDPEEQALLKIFRAKRKAEQEAAAKKRQEEYEAQVIGKFQAPPPQ